MRIKALFVLGALALSAAPAFAQQSCQQARNNNQVGGAIVGGILGGVLGSQVAGSGHRSDGTAVGAIVGGLLGAGVSRNAVPCAASPGVGYGYGPGSQYNVNPNYGGQYYGQGGYGDYGSYPSSDYGYAPGYDTYPSRPGASSYRYADDVYGDARYDDMSRNNGYRSDLDDDYRRAYKRNDDYAGLECSEATQVSRLADGSEIHRPVTVCRDADDGEWRIRD